MKTALLRLAASGVALCLLPCSGHQRPNAGVAPTVRPQVAAASAVPQNTGSAVPAAQAQAALDLHNAKRAEVGTPPLQWSTALAVVAQNWANHLAQTEKCNLQHSENNQYGENLFGGWGATYTVVDAANSWYSEKPKYAGGVLNDSNWAASGHYTQMVWRTTTQLGMGQASCAGANGGDGWVVFVAEYSPAGNMLGEKAY